MARGQKYNEDLKEKAIALLTVNNSVSFVARELKLPRSTVKSWKEDYDKKAQEGGEDTIAKLRQKKKEDFVDNAWKLINDSMTVAQKRITRELELEDSVDKIAELLKANSKKIGEETGIGWFELLNLIDRLKTVKNFKLSELSTLVGTMYDKQALANKEATQIVDFSYDKLMEKINKGEEF